MVYDPLVPNVEGSQFEKQDWSNNIYTSEIEGELKDEIPPNTLDHIGHGLLMRIFDDSDHACCAITRKSRTRLFIF